jgi:triphosphoribosyl-dephospho-CoA synthase
MDAHTFMRSLFALRHYFPAIFELGREGAPFASLEACGIAAEQRMLAATAGINTHRGAIFSLGLLCAAAGAVDAEGGRPHPATLRAALRRQWGEALAERALRVSALPGGVAARRYGLRSASQEAALGFPVIFETAAPALERAIARGLSPQQARIDTLFAVMAVLDDSNLAHRGGLDGLRFAQDAARRFLDRGGIAASDGLQQARAVHRDFVARRLSPGGAADALAAACWLWRIGEAS